MSSSAEYLISSGLVHGIARFASNSKAVFDDPSTMSRNPIALSPLPRPVFSPVKTKYELAVTPTLSFGCRNVFGIRLSTLRLFSLSHGSVKWYAS